jgi:hypothetical protein
MESVMFNARLKFWAYLLLAAFVLTFSKVGNAAITDGKFGINQIFDVQYWWNGSTLNASNFIAPYDKNFNTVTATTGQYFQFFNSTTNPGQHGLKLMNSNGTQARIIHDYGDITALGNGAIFYIGSGFFGNVISTAQGYNYGASASFTNMDTDVTSSDLNNYTYASSTPLAAGQTAAPPAPTTDYRNIYTNSSNLYITNIYPTSNNSPPGEGAANAFDNNPNTKYLNFDKRNAGVTIKLSQGRVVKGFTITTANDFSGRDPTSYKLFGSNNGTNWTLLSEGGLSLSNNRFTTSAETTVSNTNAYVYYYMFFPTTKAGEGCGLDCDSMQIAEITYIYDNNNTTTSVDTGTGSVANPSDFCCGGSGAPFSADIGFINRLNNFVNAPSGSDNRVVINQIGNNNVIHVGQGGIGKKYVEIEIAGSNNQVVTTQSSTNLSSVNYMEISINGNNNNVENRQQNWQAGGTKSNHSAISGNNNQVEIWQKDGGNHYASVTVVGGNKTVGIIQEGNAAHMAKVELSGGSTAIDIIQSGSTQKSYSINHNCAQISCAAITVTQGQ